VATQVLIDVFCLVPYRTESRCRMAPLPEPAFYNREIVFAFKNGRAVSPSHGGHSFKKLIRSIVTACQKSPLAERAKNCTWVPVPRSGVSKPSFDPGGDSYPCETLALEMAHRLGGKATKIFADQRHFAPKKHDVLVGLESLAMSTELPSSEWLVLVDDTFVTGATLASCAIMLRDHGYGGEIAAFCVGYDVDPREASMAQVNKIRRQITWKSGNVRPEVVRQGTW
jgi:hypothetical protein